MTIKDLWKICKKTFVVAFHSGEPPTSNYFS